MRWDRKIVSKNLYDLLDFVKHVSLYYLCLFYEGYFVLRCDQEEK